MTDLASPTTAVEGSFGSRLRALRETAGLTQEELAERAGLTSYAVSALERGRRQRPYPHTVRSLLDALGADDAQRAQLMGAVPRRGVVVDLAPAQEPAPAAPAPAAPPQRRGLAHASRLLGRDQEARALADMLTAGDRRIVTLTGTGGVGKTRLAAAVADEVAPRFTDGAAFVPLAPLTDAAQVLPAVARALGSPSPEGPEGLQALLDHLAPLRVLLVLDNLEHLLDAAEQVADLAARCPRLVVLVTSRAPLRVRDEHEFPVQPLAVPDEAATDPAVLRACAAVEVFADRARAVSPGFEVTADNAAAVGAVCRRLAGIPLALELAAARVRFLDPRALLARLDEAMARGGGPDLPARQRTLRATFDWSYDLLSEQEQLLLRVLAVFHDGCTLDAVEEVFAAQGSDEPVLPLLEVLVEHSLVVVGDGGEGPRFGLLEPIAQYARSRQDHDEAARVRDAHLACFLALTERAGPEYQVGDQVLWLDRMEREDANVTAALSWALERADGDSAGRMGWALWLYWWLRARMAVGRRLMRQAVQLPMEPVVHARARLTAACMAFALGDVASAGTEWRSALEAAEEAGDPLAIGQAQAGCGLVALTLGDLDTAEADFRRSLPALQGDSVYARWLDGLVRIWLGTVHFLRGDADAAVVLVEEGLASAHRRGDRLSAYIALFNLSEIAMAQQRYEDAHGHLLEGVRLTRETGDLANLVYFLQALTVVESAAGRHSRVSVLVGAADAVRETVGAGVYGYYKPDEALREAAAAAALDALGEEVHGDCLDAGRALSPAEAVAYALGEGDGAPRPA